jgi:glycosyltransferase involved in cell wall biosynthesis
VTARFVAPAPQGDVSTRPVPTFSVVIAAYNAAHLVGEAVQSALDQTLPPHEIVVCDDESTDDIAGALRPFRERVTLMRIPHGGEGAAKNAAVERASGEFVAILDADDVYLPGRLEALGELAAARPDLDVLTTNAFLELEGEAIGTYYPIVSSFPAADQVTGIIEDSSSIFGAAGVRRERLVAVGGFAADMRTAADWELWLRLALGGSRFGLVDEPLARYRLQPAGLTADKATEWRGCVDALDRVSAGISPTAAEREALERSLRKHREWALLAEAERALRGRSADARARARAVAFGDDFGLGTRAKALFSLAAPRTAGRLLDRRERETGRSRLRRRLPSG